jgi:hypothetical protein
MTERERFRAYTPELALLLWAVWNPIDVGVPLDEVRGLCPDRLEAAVQAHGSEELATRLDDIAAERMGVGRGTATWAEPQRSG